MKPLDKVIAISNSATDRRLSGTARALLSYLIDCANHGNEVWWGKDRLAGVLDRDRRTVARAFKSLIELGYIIKANPNQVGRGAYAVYRVFSAVNGGKAAPRNPSERGAKLSSKGGQNCPSNLLREYINSTPPSPPQLDHAEPGLASARQVAPRTPPDARGAARATSTNPRATFSNPRAKSSSTSDAVTKAARQEGDAENSERYDQPAALIRRIKAFKISEDNAASWLRGMIQAGATEQEISDLLDQSKARNDDREKLLAWGKSLLAKKHLDAMPTLQPVPRPDRTTAVIMAAADNSAKLEPGHPLYNVLTSFGTAMAAKGKGT